MATLEQLTIEVDGDVSGATSSLARLEQSASSSASSTGSSLQRVSDGFDTTETRAQGMADTVAGSVDVFTALSDQSLSTSDRLQLLGQGMADLAGGIVNFVIPAISQYLGGMAKWVISTVASAAASARQLAVTIAQRAAMIAGAVAMGVVTAAQWLWNAAMTANPIGLVIAAIVALIAIIVLLVVNWDRITKFLKDVWEKAWNGIVSFFKGAWGRIASGLSGAVAFVRTMFAVFPQVVGAAVSQIGSFLSGIWNGITDGLQSALNGAIWLINSAIAGINTLIRGANAVPGVSIPSIPSIPFLAEGGIATGPTLAMIGEGANDEAVIPLPKGMRDGLLGGSGGATEVTIRLEGDEDLVRLFRRGIKDRGGNVQAVLGT